MITTDQMFKMFFDQAKAGILLVDAVTNKIILSNAAFCRLTGYSQDEISSLCVPDTLTGNDLPSVPDRGARQEQGGITGAQDIPLRKKDGTVVHAEISSWPVSVDGNRCLLVLFLDIAVRKEEALIRSEAFVKNILDTVDEGFIVIDPAFRIITANKAYCRQVDLPFEEIVNRQCYEISHKALRPCFEEGKECAVRNTLRTGEPSVSIHEHEDGEGKVVYVETKSFPVKDASGEIVSVIEIVNNITERRRLEEQLRQAQKMEAVGLLAGGIAHDFNNILSAIMGYGNLLEMKLTGKEPYKAYVDHILSSAQRAARLTQSLLAFSRKQVINPKPVDLNEIVRRIEKLLSRLISEEIELRTSCSGKALMVFADSGQLEQVLMNLATNARDAMPDGGSLSMRTSVVELNEMFVRFHGHGKTGRYALIEVSDTGIGMDEKTRQRIFEPFFTTKELGRGTGLGLAIVYGMVNQSNGFIDVYSEPGEGTVFRIYLPLIEPEEEEKQSAVTIAVQRGTETILLAEDDEILRRLSASVLKEFGYTVIEARDGEDALSKYLPKKESIQLLVLDVVMPKKNGKEVYETIKEMTPDIKALFLSGYTADIVHNKGILEQHINFMSKPISPRDLLAKVREILDGSE